MGKKKIGIIFGETYGWAGGFYYVLNLIKSLNYLPESEKPALVVFYEDDKTIKIVQELRYPFVQFLPINKKATVWEQRLLKIANKFGIKNIIQPLLYSENVVEIALPNNFGSKFPSLARIHRAYWIPDFQHKYYPENFASTELLFREENTNNIVAHKFPLILSSQSAARDFNRFYPEAKNLVHVFPFCSLLTDFQPVEIDSYLSDRGISGRYFISPNQFWKHKNHIVVLKAAKILKDRGVNVCILFTGNEAGNEEYVSGLKQYVEDNGLGEKVKFLGFLDRNVQLSLIQHAQAVIQPSLFEGWSTVVEDAKALGKYVIASNLEVHMEQLVSGADFFDPLNEEELADLLEQNWNVAMKVSKLDYNQHVIDFARKIVSIL